MTKLDMPWETRKAEHSSCQPVLTHSESWGGSRLKYLKINQGAALGHKLLEERSSEVQRDIPHSETFPTQSGQQTTPGMLPFVSHAPP